MLRKPVKIVSKKIRRSAMGERCTLRVTRCSSRETVVLAHLNSGWKGVGTKSPDIFAVYACQNCHSKLDMGHVDFEDQLRALMETQMRLYEKDLIQIQK